MEDFRPSESDGVANVMMNQTAIAQGTKKQ
jgi:hypothetical protein